MRLQKTHPQRCFQSVPVLTCRLASLETSNMKLKSLNALSEHEFQTSAASFRQRTKTLQAMKRDLDSVFRRIRFMCQF